MKRYRMTTDSKKHFESIIKDLRKNGFNIVTYTNTLAELESATEFVVIEIVK